MSNWHTTEEKAIIRRLGGRPMTKSGYDGFLYGKPCEVRSVRKDDRYRIQRNTHMALLRGDGNYVFIDNGRHKLVSAQAVNRLLTAGAWYTDRKPQYTHKFIRKNQIF